MPRTPLVRVYMACSLDGYIAGPNDDLSWLETPREASPDLPPDGRALDFDTFLGQVGCMVMGRTTYDTVASFGGWPYGDVPVWVATRRPLEPVAPTVSSIQGSMGHIVAEAKREAGERDVYLDGGNLVQQALNAGLVDEITATMVPTLLGAGTRLFDGLTSSSSWQFVAHHTMDNGMVQLIARALRD